MDIYRRTEATFINRTFWGEEGTEKLDVIGYTQTTHDVRLDTINDNGGV